MSASPEEIFALSRILYLCTASPTSAGHFILDLIEGRTGGHSKNVAHILVRKLDLLSASVLGGENMAGEAMTDLLKFTFNLLVHYPKVRGRL
jgi:hypothetical protein